MLYKFEKPFISEKLKETKKKTIFEFLIYEVLTLSEESRKT